MEPRRFDSLTRSLASRVSRRTALQATGVVGAAGLLTTTSRFASAQDATPDPLSEDATFLFVQSATSGTFAASPAAGADYLLTLSGHAGNTVYFSDRPERIFGTAPTQAFLDGLGFAISDPPNAALVTNDADGNEDILVVELVEPTYDDGSGTVTYGVNILSDYEGGLDFAAGRQQDEDLSATFGEASLFIDDCSDGKAACATSSNCWGNISYGNCWSWSNFGCYPCENLYALSAQCNAAFSGCNGQCVAATAQTCDVG